MLYIPYLINIFFYFQMVQAIQVLRFHLLELEKVSIILRGDKHIFSKINLIAILTLLLIENLRCNGYIDLDIQISMHFLDTSSIICPRHTSHNQTALTPSDSLS